MLLTPLIAAAVSGLLMVGCTEGSEAGESSTVRIIRLGSEDSTSVSVRFEPSENTEYYVYAIGNDSDYGSFVSGTMEGMERAEGPESKDVTFQGLEANESYTVYARATSESGNEGGVAMLTVSTPDTRMSAELQYVTPVGCGFKVSFTQEYYEARYYLGTSSDREAFLAGEKEDGRLTEVDDYGCVNYYDGIEPGEYVFYAIGYDRYGMESELFEVPVTVPETAGADMPDAEFETMSLDIYKGTFRFTPNDACGKITCSIGSIGYVSNMISSSGWKNDAVAMLDSWSNLSGSTVPSHTVESGVLEFDNYTTGLQTGYGLELYVLTYDKDGNPAGVRKYEVSTPAEDPGLPVAGIEEIKVENITTAGATYTIRPDENTFAIVYDTYDADYYDQVTSSSSYHEFFIHEELLGGETAKFSYGNGEVIYAETQGTPYTEYLLCVAPMNGNGPVDAGWGELAVSERYRTLAE